MEKTDKKLLELAAKAAGISGHFAEKFPEDGHPGYSYGIWISPYVPLWNPLANDGDSLRLAVKCSLHLGIEKYSASAWPAGDLPKFCGEPFDDDACAATRRAIVRAAAEIGKGMK